MAWMVNKPIFGGRNNFLIKFPYLFFNYVVRNEGIKGMAFYIGRIENVAIDKLR